jgi:transcriptional regulator with PAS, ATPase and Fis domain
VESELFGYVKGAFTGALADTPGKIELAHGGTLFLDEVAELRPDLQVKLLRVVEEKEVERLGSTKGRKIDFRLIAATNRDIAEAIRNGVFREDLYYRVSTIPVHLPPLRERGRDFERLVERLLRRYAEEMGRKPVLLSPDALGLLRKYRWPGNIRELENVLKRAVILLDHGVKEIDADVFSYLTDRKPESTCSFDAALTRMSTEMISGRITFKQLERRILTGILDRFSGNIKAAGPSMTDPADSTPGCPGEAPGDERFRSPGTFQCPCPKPSARGAIGLGGRRGNWPPRLTIP